ncbi:hypothetical protein N7504_004368 [Penicillium tannophilum]|nr:hypothetical protein N7504_004368 [Penicillium tannophilum]
MNKDNPETTHGDAGPETSSFHRRLALPAWLDHFNVEDLKIVLRCWVAIWVSSILMFIQPSLNSIGVATFFGPLMLYLIPPTGVLSAYLVNTFFLLLGMCLAWAWGLITMKAALAARPSSQTRAMIEKLNHQVMLESQGSDKSVSWITEKLIHEGFMLDARVTVVFYVMSCIFVYTMARLRVANPKFAPGEVFGNIVMDLFLLYGPTLPSFTGELGKVLVLPGAIGIGLGVASCLLFFPQSTSYSILLKMEEIVETCQTSLQFTRTLLAGGSVQLGQLYSTKAKNIAILKAIQPMLSFLPVDISRCRWNTQDIRSLYEPMRQFMAAHVTLLDFHIARAKFEQRTNESQSEKTTNEDILETVESDNYQLREDEDLTLAWEAPELGLLRSQTKESLNRSMTRILPMYSECLCTIEETFRFINTHRWRLLTPSGQPDRILTQGESLLNGLKIAKRETVNETADLLIECHADIFNEEGSLKSPEFVYPHSLRSLALAMVIEERILQCVEAGEELLTKTLQLSRDRPVERIWFPDGLRYTLSWLLNGVRDIPMSMSFFRTDPNPETANIGRTDPPRFRLTTRIIRNSYHWLTDPAGIYALRMVVVTIATAIPGSLPHTAGFFYREKGLWGVITAQICVLVYMADFVFSLCGRVVGTIIGGVLGMVAWYIGSGSGPGNPYGLSAITAIMTLVLVWCRIFFPHSLVGTAVMSGVSFVLVVGFSYDATHIETYGLPGYGYEAFYKRVVTVLLGILAALIVQIFPHPPSASQHVRKSLSGCVRTLSDNYAALLSCWNREDSEWANSKTDQISLQVTESLLSLQGPIGMLKLEPSMGPFSQQTLERTRELCLDINQSFASLLNLQGTLPLTLQNRLARTVGIQEEENINAIMLVLRVIDQALKTGDPLPERLPTLRTAKFAGSNRHVTDLSTTLVRDSDYRRYCIAVISYLKFLSAVDNIVLFFKDELGQSHIVYGLGCAEAV